MRLKISLKWFLFIISLTGIVLSSVIVFSLVFNLPVQISQAKPASLVRQADLGLPARLLIPKIKVNTALESVGLTPDGAMKVPKGLNNAAWYNLGPRPGDIGSAVIDGHYGVWKNGTRGVFNNLLKLRRGDKLYVKNKKGATATFVVRELRTLGDNDDATDVFFSSDGKAHLNLITCEGIWDKVLKSYPKRLVVFTDKVE